MMTWEHKVGVSYVVLEGFLESLDWTKKKKKICQGIAFIEHTSILKQKSNNIMWNIFYLEDL